jgi:hypothetical protein
VLRYTGSGATGWEAVGPATGFSAGQANYISLALDGSDVPYVAYRDGANSDKATVMRYNTGSGAWETVGSAGFSAGEVEDTSLALDSSGVPYVAYGDGGNSDKATVMRYTGGAWQLVGSAGFSAGSVRYTSLALDGSDVPYVAYEDGANSEKATVMCYTGGSWQVVGSAGFSAGSARYTSLALDSSDVPYVAYRDAANGSGATVMRYTGGSWQTVGSAGFTAGTAQGVSIVLDSTGAPYVGFENGADGHKAAVMRHPGFISRSVAYASITAGQWYTFSTGCGGVYFTDIGSIDAVTLTARFGYTAKLEGGLPRDYDVETHGGGAYQADVRLCYDDVDLVYAGIDPAQEPNLHAYRFVGAITWQEYSVVDTTNNHVTAEDVTNLDEDWGLGISADQPTALALSTVEAGGGLPYLAATVATVALGVTVALAYRRRRQDA